MEPEAVDSGVIVERREAVTVVRMERGENRFHPDLLTALESAIDEIAGGEEPCAFVLTGSGKFFSNGLDLDYMGANPDEAEAILARVHGLFGRVLGLDVPTVAAINGHAFAAGAMLAISFDLAVMRADRGYFCLPEADIGIPFTPAMNALLTARMSPPVAHRAMATAHRYPGAEALEAGIVTELADEDEVLDRAVELASGLAGKPRQAVGAIKRGMYGDVLDLLDAT
ncbi:MAG: enoyl-CoA hydratase/isomerase family protein [Solirubrobacterales bacterium]